MISSLSCTSGPEPGVESRGESLKPLIEDPEGGAADREPEPIIDLTDLVEYLAPTAARFLRFLHLDQCLQMRSWFRVLLLFTACISLIYICIWVESLKTMRCYDSKRTGLDSMKCQFQVVAIIGNLLVFRFSLLGLCYFTDANEQLNKEKAQLLQGMLDESNEGFKRLSEKVKNLNAMTAANLQRAAVDTLRRMRGILRRLKADHPGETRLYKQLLSAAASYFGEVRRPAFRMAEQLEKVSKETGDATDIEALAVEVDKAAQLDIASVIESGTVTNTSNWRMFRGCRRWLSCGGSCASQTALRLKRRGLDLQSLAQPYSGAEAGDQEIMRPMVLVLEVMKASTELTQEETPKEKQSTCTSTWWWLFFGTCTTVVCLVFYAVTLKQDIQVVIGGGSCASGPFKCMFDMVWAASSTLVMTVYVYAVTTLLCNVKQIDSTMVAIRELNQLQELKDRIGNLTSENRNGQTAMLVNVHRALAKHRDAVDRILLQFVDYNVMPLENYEELLKSMKS